MNAAPVGAVDVDARGVRLRLRLRLRWPSNSLYALRLIRFGTSHASMRTSAVIGTTGMLDQSSFLLPRHERSAMKITLSCGSEMNTARAA